MQIARLCSQNHALGLGVRKVRSAKVVPIAPKLVQRELAEAKSLVRLIHFRLARDPELMDHPRIRATLGKLDKTLQTA
jgi:hypothetical protein